MNKAQGIARNECITIRSGVQLGCFEPALPSTVTTWVCISIGDLPTNGFSLFVVESEVFEGSPNTHPQEKLPTTSLVW